MTGRRLFILGNSFSKPIPLNPFPFLYIPQFSRFTLLVYLTLSHEQYNANPTQVALAWLIARPTVTAPIASATSLEQLDDLIAATHLKLDEQAIHRLDSASAY